MTLRFARNCLVVMYSSGWTQTSSKSMSACSALRRMASCEPGRGDVDHICPQSSTISAASAATAVDAAAAKPPERSGWSAHSSTNVS